MDELTTTTTATRTDKEVEVAKDPFDGEAIEDVPWWLVWCGVVWCGVVWCGVVWCNVMWRGGSGLNKLLSGITQTTTYIPIR